MKYPIIFRTLTIARSQIAAAYNATNTWLDKPITDGAFLEGFLCVMIALCAILADEFYGAGVLFVFLYLFLALLKSVVIGLENLTISIEHAERKHDKRQILRRPICRIYKKRK